MSQRLEKPKYERKTIYVLGPPVNTMFVDYTWQQVERIQRENRVREFKGFRKDQEQDAHRYITEKAGTDYKIQKNNAVEAFGYPLSEYRVWAQTHKAEDAEIQFENIRVDLQKVS